MNFVKQLENAPRNLVLYVLGLVGAIVDDYTLVTLTVFCVLLGFVLHSVLIPAATFFGLYFLMRLVMNMAEAVAANAHAKAQNAQATLQVAAALAQFRTPHEVQGVSVEGDILP